ncbi:MAG: nucleotide exchange factor GrpE [Bacteroidales bacterium]|nr:nucleotide exchange factor GrpE [Bacteroidales bacterium]
MNNLFNNQNSRDIEEIKKTLEEMQKNNAELLKKNEEIVKKNEEIAQRNEDLQKANEELKNQNNLFQDKLNQLEKKADEIVSSAKPVEESKPEPSPVPDSAPASAQSQTDQPVAPVKAELPKEVTEMLKKIDTYLVETTYKDGLIKDIHNELQQYKTGLRQEIVKPVMKDIILIYDALAELMAKYPEGTSEDASFVALRKEANNVMLSIDDLLYAYDIEIVKTSVGDPFDPKVQKAMDKRPAPTDEQDKTIAVVLKTGFKNSATGHMFRDPQVIVYAKTDK